MTYSRPSLLRLPLGFAQSRTRAAVLPLALSTLLAPLSAMAQLLPWIGLTGERAQLLVEEIQGGHRPDAGDRFGTALTAGDFNSDGSDDLVVGIPGEDCAAGVACGMVQVRFGWQDGGLGSVLNLDPAAPGAPDPAEARDRYGAALAVGDFNADGRDDLAVGAPDESLATHFDGAVQVHYGVPGEQGYLQSAAEHMLHQNTPGVPGEGRFSEHFGHAMAAGDFNGDGHDDLAIGAPWNEHAGQGSRSGNVVVAHGHIGGLFPVEAFEMRLGLQGLPDAPEPGDEFGRALAAGDFNGDGYDDLAVGVPGEDGVGAVLVVYGSPNSLIFANHWYFSQWDLNQTTTLAGRFGAALAVGDIDGDGYDDLAVGSPGYDGSTPAFNDLGIVALVYGAAAGVSAAGHQFLWEDRLLGVGHSELGDEFGGALTAADFDGDGFDELAIGGRLEDDVTVDSGAVTVLPGHPQRFIGLSRRLRPGDPRLYLVPDNLADNAHFGAALAAGDFDGNGYPDLAIGAPQRNRPGDPTNAGAVALLRSREASLFQHDFERPPQP